MGSEFVIGTRLATLREQADIQLAITAYVRLSFKSHEYFAYSDTETWMATTFLGDPPKQESNHVGTLMVYKYAALLYPACWCG
jgi:hypothetical protein